MASFDSRTKSRVPFVHLVGRRRSIVVVLAALVVSALVMMFAPDPVEGNGAGSNLPADAESSLARKATAELPGSEQSPAFVVLSRDGEELTPQDLAAAAGLRASLADLGEASPPIPSEDGTVALVAVPLPTDVPNDENADNVQQVRDVVAEQVPDGVTAQVTGGPAVQADLGKVFDGADTRLLAVTAAVVAILLLITYRSPWLWLVPLTVIGVGDRVAAVALDYASSWLDEPIDGSITGITSVLVFGAGTNYALLLIARYREELRRYDDRRDAMRHAVGAAAPAILSSSGTVALGLVALTLADSPFVSRIGAAGALGIVVAVLYALVVLPSAMVLPGRWLFWPFVPRQGQEGKEYSGFWGRLGTGVTRRPVTVLVVSLVALVAMAAPLLNLRTGLGQSEQFLEEPESIAAQKTLSESFPGGISSPTTVVATADRAEDVAQAAKQVDGVQDASVERRDDRYAEISVTLSASPGTDASLRTIEELRTALDDADPDALVGGADAEDLDERATASDDRSLLVPIVLGVVLVMLLVLLRSVVAALLLAATTVLSYLSALGVGWLAFQWLDYSAMDVSTPLLGFIFLVALGVDYNIFLTARAREETAASGDPTDGIVRSLAVTGGVITSAGILLAAVFTVLGVLPLVLLAQLGVIVGFGVLLDTLLVRSVVTPALVAVTSRWFWWPGRLARTHREGAHAA
jgi:RND superfamily putative drug exporter